MGMIERDPHTGHGTTGHEWNGIKELNTKVPRLVWACLIAAVMFSVAWWILMPAWPIGTTYTKGLLGNDVRKDVAADLHRAAEQRLGWTQRVDTGDFAAILADDTLMQDVRATGYTLFGDNCAACHGLHAQGGPGFPDLVDDTWLWGGAPDTVFETIRVGVNADHPDTRSSEMLAWGRDGLLSRDAVLNVTDYVYSLSHPDAGAALPADRLAAGKTIFTANCAICHGEDGTGISDLGGPDLTDGFWLYGGNRQSIYETVHGGRQGHMPAWENRLTDTERKILALYVLDLGRGAP